MKVGPGAGHNPAIGLGIGSTSGGDTSGPILNQTVTGLRGVPICVAAVTPTLGDLLTFDGTEWCPAGPVSSTLIVEELDTSPSVAATEIHVPNGSLIVAGTIATLKYVTPEGGGLETIQAHGNTGSTETFDLVNGNVHTATLDANCTFTFAAVTSGKACSFTMLLTQDGTGSRLVTWPGSIVWPDGVAPTLSTAAGSVDPLTFFTLDGGTIWYGFPTGGGTGSAIEVLDDGLSLTAALASLDFVGAGVTATVVGADVTVTIPGGATASDAGIWRPLMDGAGNVITDGTTGEAIMAFGSA